jgi:hypothetical protein
MSVRPALQGTLLVLLLLHPTPAPVPTAKTSRIRQQRHCRHRHCRRRWVVFLMRNIHPLMHYLFNQ